MTDEFGLLDALRRVARLGLAGALMLLAMPLVLVAVATAVVMLVAIWPADELLRRAKSLAH